MNTKKKYIEIGLIAAILVMTIFTFFEISKTFKNNTQSPESYIKIADVRQDHPEEIVNNTEDVDLQWVSLTGEPISLSDFEGSPIVLNFWASWCPPCLAEMPLLQDYADKLSDEVVFLAINAGEDEEIVRNFTEEHNLSLTILLDPSNTAAKHYRVYGFPTTLFFDIDGSIQSIHIGELDDSLLAKHLSKIGIEK